MLRSGLADGNIDNITRRVPIAIGPTFSLEGLPAALVAAAIGVAHICASCGSPDLSDKDTYPTVSRVYPADNVGGRVMAELVHSFGYENIAVIARNDAWGIGIMDQFIITAQV